MALGKRQRRADRRARIQASFPVHQVEAALDLLHLADCAWHDAYGPRELEVRPDVLDDILLLADGDLATLVVPAKDAVEDFRDVRMAADEVRAAQSAN